MPDKLSRGQLKFEICRDSQLSQGRVFFGRVGPGKVSTVSNFLGILSASHLSNQQPGNNMRA